MDPTGHKDKKPVPKFGSFKLPVAAPAPPPPPDRRPRDEQTRHDGHSKSRHRRRRTRSRSPGRSGGNPRQRSPVHHNLPLPGISISSQAHIPAQHQSSRSRHERSRHHRESELPYSKTLTDAPIIDETIGNPFPRPDPPLDDIFFVDSKGDRHNLTYGSSHRYAIPRYRRIGNGYVLGNEESSRIDRDSSTDQAMVLLPYVANPYTSGLKPLSDTTIMGPPAFRIRNESYNVLDLTKDFVSLGCPGQPGIATEDDWGEPPPITFNRTRLIPPECLIEPAPEEEIDWNSTRIDLDKERKSWNAELWRAVNANPQDVGIWLKLVDHQDALILGPDEEKTRKLTIDERRGLADVKLSLYEKALARVGATQHKHRLLLGRLQVGAQLWDSQKLLREWKKTLEENPQNINIWVRYLDYRQTECPEFGLRECLTLFAEALLLNLHVTEAGPTRDQIHVYIFLRVTLLLREAGYLEMAVGLWQAVIEFCFFRPRILDHASEEQTLDAFRIFWDSEVPRVGEQNATGWRGAIDGSQERVHPETTRFATDVDPSSLISSWTLAEKDRSARSSLPSRSLDSTMPFVNDPYRVLLFTDISDFLRPFYHFTMSNIVVEGFLHFWQLPHISTLSNFNNTRLWDWDTFLHNDLGDDHQVLSSWMPPRSGEGEHRPVSPLHCPISNFIHSTPTFFTSPALWFNSFRSWNSSHYTKSRPRLRDYLQHTLRSLVDNMPDDESLTEYYLAFEFSCDPLAAKRIAKKVVKKKAWSLKIWNAYASIEYGMREYDMARRVWATTLSSGYPEDSLRIHSMILWNSWIWSELESGNVAQALYLLHAIPSARVELASLPKGDAEPFFSTTTILQTINHLRDWRDRALAHASYQAYVAYTDCLALAYYSSDWPLKSCIDAYSEAIEKIAKLSVHMKSFKGLTSELLHQARAHFLLRHISRGTKNEISKNEIIRPSELRAWLKDSLTQFPHNSIFLAIFIWNESRILLMDRVRDSYDILESNNEKKYELDDDVALTPQNIPISNYFFVIYHEFCRASRAGGTSHSVRAAFEKVLGEVADPKERARMGGINVRLLFGVESARSSVLIWKLYILYERYAAQDINAAKGVFIRAIQACPWSKELIMLGFEHLRDDLPGLPLSSTSRGLTSDQLVQVYTLMDNRQLRVHLDILPQLLEQFNESPGGAVQDDIADLSDYVDEEMADSV